jgi:chromate transporter, chromate ion transporter (CHR) family
MSTVVAAPGITRGLGWYFLRLGALGFGGPIALVGAMHRDLVEQRGWISEEEYREGIALAQLSPGPLAAQLCFYIGYVRGGIAGATLAGLSFVLPSFLMVLALGWAYTLYQGLPWMQAVFYGVAAAVIGLISRSAWLLTRKTIGRDTLLWGIYLLVAVATIATGRELVGLILLGGFATWLWRVPPAWLRRIGHSRRGGAPPADRGLLRLRRFVRFWQRPRNRALPPRRSGPPARLAHRAAVHRCGRGCFHNAWPRSDHHRIHRVRRGRVCRRRGCSRGHISPLFSADRSSRSLLPEVRQATGPRRLRRGHNRAATGAIAGSVVVLARGALIDVPTVVIALAALAIAVWIRKVPDPLIMLAAALAGLLIR